MNRAQSPAVSVIIPVHNGVSFLKEALESILNQTLPAAEILVVDDASTDGTASVLESFEGRIRAHVQARHAGAWSARNFALAQAKGDFLAFMDADDLSEPDRFERQAAVLRTKPEVDLVFGHMIQFSDGEDGRKESAVLPGRAPGTLMARREAFEKTGPFETRWRTAGFLHWSMTCDSLGLRSVMLPEVVLRRRIHGRNSGIADRSVLAREYAEVIAEFKAKRNASQGREG